MFKSYKNEKIKKFNNEEIEKFKEKSAQIIEVLNILKVLIFEIDKTGIYRYVAPSSLKLLPASRNELIGKSFFDIFPFQKANFFLENVKKALKEKQTINIKYPLTIENSEYWFETFILPQSDEKVLFVVREIRKEKEVEEQFEIARIKYFTLFEYANDAIFLLKNYLFIDCNSKALEMFGCKKEEIIGKSPVDYSPKFQSEGILSESLAIKKMNKVLKGDPQIFEWKHIKKDGTTLDTEVSLTKIEFQNEEYILALVRDITKRKKIESKLKESVSYARALFENTDIPLVIIDPQTLRYIDCNMAAVKIYGCEKKEDIIGKTPVDFSTKYQPSGSESSKLAKKLVNEVLQKGSIFFEWKHKRKDGTIWDSEVHLMSLKYNNKTILQLSLKDISERKKLEREQIKLQKLESMEILVGGLAHDFNNILTGIFGNIELIKFELEKNHPAFEYIEKAETAYKRAKNLTKRLLLFSKGEEPVLDMVNLKNLIKEVVDFNLSGSNIKPHINFQDDLWEIEADKGQLSEVISNLIINSIQAMPEGGNLYISAENFEGYFMPIIPLSRRLKKKYIKITIKDEGCGIPEDKIDKIFDPYFTTKKNGNGLGLSIVHRIVRRHGGFIDVSSKVGKGTTFIIYLPAKENISKHTKIENKVTESSKIVIEKINIGKNKIKNKNKLTDKKSNINNRITNILVVDDDEMVADTVKTLLEKIGYKVDIAFDENVAIEKCNKNKNKYTFIILDLTIKGGKGAKDIVKKLLKINSNYKIIVSSGYSEDPVMKNYKKYGFYNKLNKPFKIIDLKNVLKI